MTKYYRVRTQEQWDWLMQWFEKQGVKCLYDNRISLTHISYSTFHTDVVVVENDGLITWNELNSVADTHDFIEVSQMMEDEQMEDCVTIKGEDVEKLKNEQGDSLFFMSDKQHFAYSFIEGFDCSEVNIPKSLLYPKVRMSVAEKKEFDRLKENALSLRFAFDELKSEHENYPKLCERLFNNTLDVEDSKAQNDFARAWSDESLIEVIPDRKWKVKVPRSDESYYFKDKIDGKAYLTTVSVEPKNTNGALFTDEELKQFSLDNDLFEKVEVQE